MELTERDIELLTAYWDQNLAAPEQNLLELRLQQEPEFRKAADQFQVLSLVLETARDQKILEYLQTQDKINPGKWWRWMIVVMLCVGVAGYFWFRSDQKTPQQTQTDRIMTYIQTYPSPQSTLSTNTKEESGYAVFDKGDYASAIPRLQQAFAASGNADSLLLFYIGIASLHENKPEVAVSIFSNGMTSRVIPQDDNRWFLALAYAQKGEKEKAIELLEPLKRSAGYGQKAIALEAMLLEKPE